MKPTTAWQLIESEKRFSQGSLAKSMDGEACGTGASARPWRFDCLGAMLWAYREWEPEARHRLLKPVFELCKARHGHKYLGKLVWEQAISLLKDSGV